MMWHSEDWYVHTFMKWREHMECFNDLAQSFQLPHFLLMVLKYRLAATKGDDPLRISFTSALYGW